MAYGQNSPQGLQPYKSLVAAANSGAENAYIVASGYANSIFTGDPVFQNNGGTIGVFANQMGITGGAAQAYVGRFCGCKYQDSNGVYQFLPYWIGGTVTKGAQNVEALVIDDASTVYAIQVSISTAGAQNAVGLIQANINRNANFGLSTIGGTTFNPVTGPSGIYTPQPNPGTGSTVTGQSGYFLDTSTIANTATLPLKIIGLAPTTDPNQVFYSAGPPTVGVFNTALVIFNNDVYKGGTGTAGI